jgi:hypothetical protein
MPREDNIVKIINKLMIRFIIKEPSFKMGRQFSCRPELLYLVGL